MLDEVTDELMVYFIPFAMKLIFVALAAKLLEQLV